MNHERPPEGSSDGRRYGYTTNNEKTSPIYDAMSENAIAVLNSEETIAFVAGLLHARRRSSTLESSRDAARDVVRSLVRIIRDDEPHPSELANEIVSSLLTVSGGDTGTRLEVRKGEKGAPREEETKLGGWSRDAAVAVVVEALTS